MNHSPRPAPKAPGITRDQITAAGAFVLVLAILVAGPQLDKGSPRNLAALAALLVPAAFAARLHPPIRLALLLFSGAGYLVSFGAIKTPTLFQGLSDAVLMALPAIALHLAMGFGKQRHPMIESFGWPHLYVPAAFMAAVALLLRIQEPVHASMLGIFSNVMAPIYYLYCAGVLVFVALGLWMDLQSRTPSIPEADPTRFEQIGEFGAAATLYEQDGNLEKSAQMAQKAGQWFQAAELYRQHGDYFQAGDMYYRAQRLDEALEMYEKGGSPSAAATLCVQTGQPERAARLLEKAGDHTGAVQALEQAGMRPSPQMYLKAKLFQKAADRCRELGDPMRAAEITERELGDAGAAAPLYLECGMHQHAGELFEGVGRIPEAIEAYLGSRDSILQAARLCFSSGDPARARRLLEEHGAQSGEALLILARIYCDEGRNDEAIRSLQTAKKLSGASGELAYLLGRCYLAKGLPELAEPELRMALTHPLPQDETLDAAYRLGNTLEELGRPQEAVEIYQGILSKDLYFKDVEARYKQLRATSGPPRVG